ncbi:hypothetical protein [uncultured Desulfovibrio sp.]|uniref:hypothetical protein n=1 Tax=uncultured Desulfovibrio sp. TaxID=167968 RepID=UPI00263BDC6F|nr:hypothetical protein [uncultured Desulfovibrio sp.]
MFLSILVIALVIGLAWLIRKGTKGTPFAHRCPCTPYVAHLKWREEGDTPPKGRKREHLW